MGAGRTDMANRRDRRIEPSFDGPQDDAEDGVFSVHEEDRVVPGRRKSPAKRKSSKARAPERSRGRGKKRRGLFGLFGRLVYWCFVLAIWGGIAAAGIVVYYGAKMPSATTWAIPDRSPNIKIVGVDGRLIANRGMTGGEAVGLHEMSPYIPAGGHGDRGPPLLFAFRHRPDRSRPCAVANVC